MVKKSRFLSLGARDIVRGLVVAVLTTVLTALLPMLQSGAMPTMAQWRMIGIAGAAAGCSYLLKNLFTNSNDNLLKGEQK